MSTESQGTDVRVTQEMRQAVEAILMVSDQPVESTLLAQLLEIAKGQVEQICHDLAAEYRSEQRGFVLAKVAGGYRFQTNPDLAPYVERYVLEGQSARLSAAALETLAIIAYKQPISRMQVGAIRGVMSDGVMRTLESRGYVGEIDRDPGPGNAVLFGTTPLFLERLGIDSLDELPSLTEFMPPAEVVEALEGTLRPSDLDPRDLADEGENQPAVEAETIVVVEEEEVEDAEIDAIEIPEIVDIDAGVTTEIALAESTEDEAVAAVDVEVDDADDEMEIVDLADGEIVEADDAALEEEDILDLGDGDIIELDGEAVELPDETELDEVDLTEDDAAVEATQTATDPAV